MSFGVPGDAKLDIWGLRNGAMDALFGATILATEEAIINALAAAKTMTGREGHKIIALPHDRLQAVLKKYNRRSGATSSP